jgi:hypothetical protein
MHSKRRQAHKTAVWINVFPEMAKNNNNSTFTWSGLRVVGFTGQPRVARLGQRDLWANRSSSVGLNLAAYREAVYLVDASALSSKPRQMAALLDGNT